MASLVPCAACRRHVRRHETQCRFCGAERVAEPVAPGVVLPRDVKRATLFALGLTIAGQACSGESNDVPIYGAPFVGGSGGSDSGGSGGGGGNGGSIAPVDGGGGTGNIQPVYGAPVSPAGGAGGAPPVPSPSDAGPDSGADSGSDAGN